jgi:hypothetical protein
MNVELPDAPTDEQRGPPELRRWVIGLALVPMPVVAVLALGWARDAASWIEWADAVAFALVGAEIVSTGIGFAYYVVATARQRSIDATSCLLLGATVGFLTLLMCRLLQFAVTGERHDHGLLSEPVGIVLTGISQAAFGLLGGGLLWLLNRPRPSAQTSHLNKDARLWRDLRLWRLGLGGAAYMVPFALFAALFIASGGDPSIQPVPLALFGVWFAAVWPIVGGSASLAILLRLRSSAVVRRADCLVIGMIVISLDVPVLSLLSLLAEVSSFRFANAFGRLVSAILYGGLVTPLGLLGGWLFWRIAVRPLPAPRTEWAVFE